MARKRNNISIECDTNPNLPPTTKKLRRLPHVFSRVLQLPFPADTEVSIHETPHSFRFVVDTHAVFVGDVEARAVKIHPGVTKVVVRHSASLHFQLDDLDLDVWRIRLPESTLPELATAVVDGGELVVTVPKSNDHRAMVAAASTLVLVK